MADTPASTPPAPATPAPASAPAPNPNAPAQTHTEAAAAAYLASKESGSQVPPTSDPVQEPGERGRRGDGTFRPGPAKGEREETPAAPTAAATPDAAPDAGHDAQGDDLLEDEGEDDSTTAGAPTGDEGAEDSLVVVGPGRRDGEEIEIAAPDLETAERLRQWVNTASRVEEAETLHEEAVALRREVEEFQEMLATDPDGVVLQGLEGNLEAQRHLALFLVTRPEVWAQVRDTVLQLDDPERFEFVQAKVELERHTLADQFRTVAEENRAVDQNLREVQAAVAAIIPPEVGEGVRTQFFRDALRDIASYADRHGRLTVDVRDIPLIIAQRLSLNGIDPVDAAKRIAAGGSTRRNRSTANRTAAAAPAQRSAPQAAPKPPQRTGKQMVQGARRRAVAAAIPTGGAGAQGNSLEKPPYDPSLGTSATEQAIAWHRKRAQASGVTR